MAKVNLNKIVNAPVAEVWQSWDDFGAIYKFHPALKSSHSLQGASTGLGARRKCNMKDGKNHVLEKIIGYEPQRKMVVDIYEGTMPLKKAIATVMFTPRSGNRTEVSMTMEFTPKFGILGALMIPMMKPQFRKMLQSALNANANYVEHGVELMAA